MRKEKIFNMAQQKKLSIIVLFVIVLQSIDNANTKCIPVTLFIKVDYLESSVRKAYQHTKVITTSSSFKSNYKKLAVSASVSGSGAGFSGSASASYEAVTESALSTSEGSHVERTTMTTFDPDQNQIIEKISILVTIDGRTAKTVTNDIVDSVDEKKSPSHLELEKKAEHYIKYNYGDIDGGQARKNTYQAATCVQAAEACASSEYLCSNEKCIPQRYVNDGDDDCGDGSDEACASSEYLCKNEKCIPQRYVNDGDDDCGDGSDERDTKFTKVGTGCAGPKEIWNVGNAKGQGVRACYEAVKLDQRCSKDYFTYVTRGDKNCGCKGFTVTMNGPSRLKIRPNHRADFFKI